MRMGLNGDQLFERMVNSLSPSLPLGICPSTSHSHSHSFTYIHYHLCLLL